MVRQHEQPTTKFDHENLSDLRPLREVGVHPRELVAGPKPEIVRHAANIGIGDIVLVKLRLINMQYSRLWWRLAYLLQEVSQT